MFRRSHSWLKISAVVVRPQVSEGDLAYSTEYRPEKRWRVGKRYDEVTNRNRFKTLEIILDRLSGYVGRRQYRFKTTFKPLRATLENEGIDWHDLKYLAAGSVSGPIGSNPGGATSSVSMRGGTSPIDVLFYRMGMTPSQRTILMTALDQRLCGVLVSVAGTTRSSSCCLRPGKEQHGWRCGLQGHVDEVYFERKAPARSSIILSRRATIERFLSQGLDVEIRNEPNFALEGRRSFQVSHLRKWEALTDPRFDVLTVGFDFRIHESDPRVPLQIVEAADDWRMHAEAIRLTMQELLEQSAVMRHTQNNSNNNNNNTGGREDEAAWTTTQPLEIKPGEFTLEMDENPLSLLAATRMAESSMHAEATEAEVLDEDVDDEDDVVEEDVGLELEDSDEGKNTTTTKTTILSPSTSSPTTTIMDDASEGTAAASKVVKPIEYKMRRADGSIIPWFKPPRAHRFSPDGIPEHLPFSPSIIIRAELDYGGSIEERGGGGGGGLDNDADPTRKVWERSEQLLREPDLRMSLHIHPDCCAVLPTQAEEDRFVDHVLNMARKMPFAMPFHLFYRVDPARAVQSGAEAPKQQPEHNNQGGNDDQLAPTIGLTPFGQERHQAWKVGQKFFDIGTRFGGQRDIRHQGQSSDVSGDSDGEDPSTFTLDLEEQEEAEFARGGSSDNDADDTQRFQPKRRSNPKATINEDNDSEEKDDLEREVDRLNPHGWE